MLYMAYLGSVAIFVCTILGAVCVVDGGDARSISMRRLEEEEKDGAPPPVREVEEA